MPVGIDKRPADQAPEVSADPVGTARSGPSTARLVGVDLARALAVFGMFAAHVGPSGTTEGGIVGWLMELTHGRSSVLFATLAGFSLALIAGRQQPKTGLAGRQAVTRIVIRSIILLAAGTALTMLGTGIAVILAYYGVFFLLALPFLRLRARTLVVVAAAFALVAPQLSFGLRWLLEKGSWVETIDAYDPIERLSGVGLLDILLTGVYPAMTWMPYLIAGLALSRLDLGAASVQKRLAIIGPALTLVGYGTSWLAFKLFGGLQAALQDGLNDAIEDLATKAASAGSEFDPTLFSDSTIETGPLGGDVLGAVSTDTPAWLLVASPHSGTTFEILGSLGVAITVVVGATALVARLPRMRRLATPVIAVGTMSLTVYIGHVLAYWAFPSGTIQILAAYIAGAVLFAAVWNRFFRRGPLEHLLNSSTKLARFVR